MYADHKMAYQPLSNEEVDVESPNLLPTSSKRRSILSALDIAVRVSTCILLILCSILLLVELTTRWRASQLRLVSDEFSIPHIYGTKIRYMSLSPTYDDYWTAELSDHNAMITLATHPDGTEEHGAISMFHQLHCLSSIRMALQRASNGENIGIDWNDDLHWPHCFHHLREMILCFADGTVERGIIINGTRTNAIDGAMDVRMCRDPRRLYEKRMREGVKEFKDVEYSLDW